MNISRVDTEGEHHITHQLMYMMKVVNNLFLSCQCSVLLSVIEPDFPRIRGGKPGRTLMSGETTKLRQDFELGEKSLTR